MNNGQIILISMAFTGYIIFSLVNTKILKFILSPIISLSFGFLLFFIGMGFNSTLYFVLSVIPVIIGILLIIRQVKRIKSH